MIAGIDAFNGNFLADVSQIETRISQINKEISSAIRVNQASDDPSAVAPIVAYQGEIAHVKQVQTNLDTAQTEAQTADGALQNAASLMDQLVSTGAKGASSTSDASTRSVLGLQVQQTLQQLVALANTSIGGSYIFGGDDSSAAPYSYNWTATSGVTQNTTQTNTATIRDSDGNEIVPRMTAQQIFDVKDANGNPSTGNVFQAAYDLGQALLNNNQPGIQSALNEVKAASNQVNQATTSYGDTETWIDQASQSATNHLNNLTQALSAVRDSDITTDATQLTLDNTALQAALSAHGTLSTKSLFSFLG